MYKEYILTGDIIPEFLDKIDLVRFSTGGRYDYHFDKIDNGYKVSMYKESEKKWSKVPGFLTFDDIREIKLFFNSEGEVDNLEDVVEFKILNRAGRQHLFSGKQLRFYLDYLSKSKETMKNLIKNIVNRIPLQTEINKVLKDKTLSNFKEAWEKF